MDGAWAPQSPSSYAPEEASVHPQHQGYRGSESHIAPPPFITPSSSPPQPHKPAPRSMARDESMLDAEYMPDAPVNSDNGKTASTAGGGSTLPPNVDDIVIRNHFPVARIKRIMQADDDVGKVAQVTPVVVCRYPDFTFAIQTNCSIAKALELFMISLVTKAAAEAKSRNSKRVNTVHLKQAIMNNEQFDFLNDIVSKVADAPERGEDEDGKKKKPVSRKKKKVEEDED
jgi:hypothetical protein